MSTEEKMFLDAGPALSQSCVMVAAHNEETNILACLKSILAAEPTLGVDVYVMANGCTDATESVVRELRERAPSVHLVRIRLGDKCNAWNVFIHEVVPRFCPNRTVYFFVDGDVRLVSGSLSALTQILSRDAHAHAASGTPLSGRTMRRASETRRAEHHLVGNLYALRGDFVRRIQAMGVRLPIGLEGDDGLIGALAKFDLHPEAKAWDDMRVSACPNAGFIFDSLDWRRPVDWKKYFRKLVRYTRRKYEFDLLRPIMKTHGCTRLPTHIAELYGGAKDLRLPTGVGIVWGWLAKREMHRKARRYRSLGT